MTDVTVVYDNTGRPRDELPVKVVRSSNLTSTIAAAKGSFQIAYDHPKATATNLRAKNIIVVRSDQRGIEDYAALIDEPSPTGTEITQDDLLDIKLRSAEWIFGTRYTAAQEVLSGKPGEIFAALIYAARREGYIPVSNSMAGIDTGGDNIGPIEYNYANIFEAINDLAEKNAAYWWLAPIVDANNTLQLKPYWAFKRSRLFGTPLRSTGAGKNFVITSMNQAGRYDIANHVKAVGRSPDGTQLVEYEETSRASVGYYRGVYTKVIQCPDESTVEGLIPVVRSYLAESAFMPLQIDGIIVSAPFPRVGDVCNVVLQNYGQLITARRGAVVPMSVTTATYSPYDNGLTVHLQENI